jgi:hypothetical protein
MMEESAPAILITGIAGHESGHPVDSGDELYALGILTNRKFDIEKGVAPERSRAYVHAEVIDSLTEKYGSVVKVRVCATGRILDLNLDEAIRFNGEADILKDVWSICHPGTLQVTHWTFRYSDHRTEEKKEFLIGRTFAAEEFLWFASTLQTYIKPTRGTVMLLSCCFADENAQDFATQLHAKVYTATTWTANRPDGFTFGTTAFVQPCGAVIGSSPSFLRRMMRSTAALCPTNEKSHKEVIAQCAHVRSPDGGRPGLFLDGGDLKFGDGPASPHFGPKCVGQDSPFAVFISADSLSDEVGPSPGNLAALSTARRRRRPDDPGGSAMASVRPTAAGAPATTAADSGLIAAREQLSRVITAQLQSLGELDFMEFPIRDGEGGPEGCCDVDDRARQILDTLNAAFSTSTTFGGVSSRLRVAAGLELQGATKVEAVLQKMQNAADASAAIAAATAEDADAPAEDAEGGRM